MFEAIANAAEVIAGVLGIAVTVVAIIVELAATRYNHQITNMFVREPRNLAVLSFFVATTLCCLWFSAVGNAVPDIFATVTMLMVTLSLLMLLPYFVYVFSFISPINVLNRIRKQALAKVSRVANNGKMDKLGIASAIDEITDATASAINQRDRSIAIAGVRALFEIVDSYQNYREELPAEWFLVDPPLSSDPDFASLEASALEELELNRSWLEEKILRRVVSVFADSIPHLRDVANAISIETRQLMQSAPLLEPQGIRAFNSFLRTSLNANDQRTSYYVISQYRLAAQGSSQPAVILEVARYLVYYGQLAHALRQPFLLEVAANELACLVEGVYAQRKDLASELTQLVLELDESVLTETQSSVLTANQEQALSGVRRAQLQLTTFFLLHDDLDNAARLIDDLKAERMDRLLLLRRQIERAESSHYWELTPRDINFPYLPPERRALLAEVFSRLGHKQAGNTTH